MTYRHHSDRVRLLLMAMGVPDWMAKTHVLRAAAASMVLLGRGCCAAVGAVSRWGWCGGGACASVDLLVPQGSCGRGSRVAVGAMRP